MRRSVWLLGLLSVGGCQKELAPPCRVAQSVTMAASPLTRMRDVTLQRAGSGFVMVGVEAMREMEEGTVRWAPVSMDGVVGMESTMMVPARTLRPEPWFGAVARVAAADQLVVAYVAPKPGAANQLQIMAVTQAVGQPRTAPVALVDLPAGVDPKIVRLAMGTSRSGQRALLTWGFEGQDAPPQFLILRGDAQPVAPPAAVAGSPFRWSCLGLSASRTDFGVSLLQAPVTAGAPPTWRTFELKDDGGRGFDIGVGFDTIPTGCVTASPTPRGYLLAFQNVDGTFYADYNVEKGVVNSDIVVGVLQFGGAARQPRVACVSPMGGDFTLMFDRPQGGEVWRFDAFGNPQGGQLVLPNTAGQVGPLSAVPGSDTFWATYPDGDSTTGSSTGIPRMFVRVDCPMAAPAFTRDAGGD
jgi:hypothetical protein